MPILKKQNKKQIPVRKMATNKIMTYDTKKKKWSVVAALELVGPWRRELINEVN